MIQEVMTMKLPHASSFKYEILTSSPLNPLNANGIYYVSIRNKFHQPLVDTNLTHHFPTEDAAQAFCAEIDAGTVSVYQLISESVHAFEHWEDPQLTAEKAAVAAFLSDIQAHGIPPDTLLPILAAYDELPGHARDLLFHYGHVPANFVSHPMPAVPGK